MNNISIENLTYNDTNQIRLFASQNFNWYLQKNTGVACTWGSDIKQTPQYDPISPQEIIWKIANFNLNDYLKQFNFIANIKKKQEDIISSIEAKQNILQNKNNYICMSTITNVIFIFDTLDNININQFHQFCEYIRFFNINIIIQYNLKDYKNLQFYNQIYNCSCRLILNIQKHLLNATELLQLLEKLVDKFTVSLKLHINNNSNIQISKLIDKLNNNISCILYNETPYLSTRKYLNMQSKILSKKLTNICLSQCAKKHYYKSVIGSIIIQLPCSACRYTLCLQDFNILDCEINKNIIGNLQDFKTLDEVWNHNKIKELRNNLIQKNIC